MKYSKYIIILSLFLSSCCYERFGCQEFNGIYTIIYDGFANNELDSVYLLKYQKNTNLTVLLDSTFIKADSNYNYINSFKTTLYSNDTLLTMLATNDYKIFIKNIDRTITFTEISEAQENCKTCGSSKNEKLTGIKSLKQDDILISSSSGFINQISIRK